MFDREIVSRAKLEPGGVANPLYPVPVYSLGGCIAHDVAQGVVGGAVCAGKHYWRRPTIALMSNPVERSRFKLHEIPAPFVNYFVNDITKSHLSEISTSKKQGSIVIDVTRDLFTGVIDLGGGCYIMNPAEGVGIVDGLTEETMSEDVLENVLGLKPKPISYARDEEEFMELWKFFFERKISYLNEKFDKVILLELYFTPRLATGGVKPDFVDQSERANGVLARMYAFARQQELAIVSLERSAFRTGAMVPWGGPSLTHFVPETIARLSDRVRAIVAPNGGDRNRYLVRQAYRRAQEHEQAVQWLNAEKAAREHLASALDTLRHEHASLQAYAAGLEAKARDSAAELDVLRTHGEAMASARAVDEVCRLDLIAQLRAVEMDRENMHADIAAARSVLAGVEGAGQPLPPPLGAYSVVRKSIARLRRRCLRAVRG